MDVDAGIDVFAFFTDDHDFGDNRGGADRVFNVLGMEFFAADEHDHVALATFDE